MMNKVLVRILPLLLVVWPLAGTAEVQWIDGIVAVAGQDVITRSELNTQMKIVAGELKSAGGAAPSRALLTRQVLDKMILNSLQVQRARSMGIRIDDATLDAAVRNIAAENKMDLPHFRKALLAEGLDYEAFRENIRQELAISRLQQRIMATQVNVSEQEIDDLLATSKAEGSGNQRYHLRHILIAVPEAASPDQLEKARAKARKIQRQAREGGDFAKLAASYSNGQNALKGGDLGWRDSDQLPTLFADKVRGMKAGQISDLIHSPSGFHIIKVEAVEGGAATPAVEQTRARHILLATDEVMTDSKAKRTLNALRERILGGDDFGKLAKQYSDDKGSGEKGGELGWAAPGTYVPAFEKALALLKPGEISKPFRSKFGWHIVQLEERKRAPIKEDVLRARAKSFLARQKQEEALELWLRRLRNESFVEYRLPGLETES
jgi:peptidyl-prolyl cis-trans isomerase SurA